MDGDPASSPPGGASDAARVCAVSVSSVHEFSKDTTAAITLLPGLGVAGDAHLGRTVQHRSRVRRDPTQPNLRQVHLIAVELLDELADRGHRVAPGQLGENVTTAGVDLLALGTGTVLRLGAEAEVEVTGLRNPCRQIEDFAPGLLGLVVHRDRQGRVVRRAGVMAVVHRGGVVSPGDPLVVVSSPSQHHPLEPV